MKKLILAAAVLMASAFAASAQMRPVFKIDAAANFSNQTFKVDNVTSTGDMTVGYRAGIGAEFGFANDFYVNPGLVFISRGVTDKASSTMLHQVEIPIHAGYRAVFAPKMAVSLQAGPYFSYGFLGSTKYTTAVPGFEINTTVDSYKSAYKRFNVGVGLQAAFEYSRYYAVVGYEQGILNVSNAKNMTTNDMNFFTGLGVRF